MRIKKLFFIPVFALIFGTFGVVDAVWANLYPECQNAISILDLDGNFDPGAIDGPADISGLDWSLPFNDGKVLYGTSFCSAGDISDPTPDTTPGSFCWCGLTRYYDGKQSSSPTTTTWWFSGEEMLDCSNDCATFCSDSIVNDPLATFDLNSGGIGLCEDFFEECQNIVRVSEFDGDFCNESPEDWRANGINWELVLSGGKALQGFSFCSQTDDNTNSTPELLVGPQCWCGIRSYNDGTNTFEPGVLTWRYLSADGDAQECEDHCSDLCHDYIFDDFCDFGENVGICDTSIQTYSVTYSCNGGNGSPTDLTEYASGDSVTALSSGCTAPSGYNFNNWSCNNSVGTVSGGGTFTMPSTNVACTAQWTPINYTVSFVRGSGGASGSMSAFTDQHVGDTITLPASTFTPASGYMFNGWSCNNNIGNKAVGATFPMPAANVTCTAQWTTITYPFSVTTTSLSSGATFTFDISASGTFYVNCGSGGTLSGTGVSGNTITKADTTVETYTCTYSGSTATRTIQFGGAATGYYDTGNAIYPAISFQGNTKVSSVTGNLSTIFYDLGPNSGQIPRFIGTFNGCTSLTTVPNTLFASLTRSTSYMFSGTFSNCTNFNTIPSGLFPFNNGNDGVSGAEGMFGGTFAGTNIQSIPSGLFSQITSGAQSMFGETFANCTNLDTVPSELFYFGGTAMSGQHTMFNGTFTGCTSLETLPANLFPVLTGGAVSMFIETFSGCTSLKSLPSGLFPFSGNNVSGGEYMFTRTFAGCTDLKSIPADLFSFGNHNVSGAESMFLETFKGCTGLGTASNIQNPIPSNLFSHVTSGAYGLFSGTFTNCSGLTSLPSGLFSSITTAANYMFQSTFEGCSNLTGYIPSNFFAGLVNTQNPSQSPNATGMMTDMFKSTGGLATTCPTGTQTYTTGYESYWTDSTNNINSPNHYVACEAQSLFTITYYDTDCSTVLTGMTVPTYTTSDNVTLPTPTKPGYTFNTANDKKWCTACGSGCGVGGWNAGTQTGNKNLYVAQWVGNNITVNFDSDANSCNYGGTLNVPTPSSRTGYVFTGWKQCRLNDFSANASTNGTDYGYLDGNGLSSYHTDVYNLTQRGTWATAFSYATFWGEARCSSTPGASQGATGTPSATSGEHCWCGITRYEVPGLQSACSLSSVKWLYNADAGTHEDCTNACASACGNLFQTSSTVRAAAFGQ